MSESILSSNELRSLEWESAFTQLSPKRMREVRAAVEFALGFHALA
jgi:hypothetical protein